MRAQDCTSATDATWWGGSYMGSLWCLCCAMIYKIPVRLMRVCDIVVSCMICVLLPQRIAIRASSWWIGQLPNKRNQQRPRSSSKTKRCQEGCNGDGIRVVDKVDVQTITTTNSVGKSSHALPTAFKRLRCQVTERKRVSRSITRSVTH